MRKLKRIAIWGQPCSGMSSLAIKLGKMYNLPVFHSDVIFGNNWTKKPKNFIMKKAEKIIFLDKWI